MEDASSSIMSALRIALEDEDIETRACAAEALLEFGEPPESIAAAMIDTLQSRTCSTTMPIGENRIRGGCHSVGEAYYPLRVLSWIPEAATSAREILGVLLTDPSGPVRLLASEILLKLGEPASELTARLEEGLNDSALSQREQVRLAMHIVAWGASTVDPIVTLLANVVAETEDYSARIEALEVLAMLGTAATAASDAVASIAVAESSEINTRVRAAGALVAIGVELDIASPLLCSALDEALAPHMQAEALRGLAKTCPTEVELIRIRSELDSTEPIVRCASAFALASNDQLPADFAPVLYDLLSDPVAGVRWHSTLAIGALTSFPADVARHLVELVRYDESRDVRIAAAWTLGRSNIIGWRREFFEDSEDIDTRAVLDRAAILLAAGAVPWPTPQVN